MFCWLMFCWLTFCWMPFCWLTFCWFTFCWFTFCWFTFCWLPFVDWHFVGLHLLVDVFFVCRHYVDWHLISEIFWMTPFGGHLVTVCLCTVECTEPPGTSICILEDLRPVSKLIQIAMTKSGGWLSPGTGGHRVDDHQSTLSPNIPAHNYSDSSLFLWTGKWPAFSAGDKICTLSLLTIDTLLTVEKSWTLLRIFLS